MYQTPEEVAAELQVTRRTVYEWLRSGRLRGLRAGRGWRIRPEDVEAFLQNGAPTASVDEVKERSEGAESAAKPMPIEEFLALPPEERIKRNRAAIELLQSWLEEDKNAPQETDEEFLRALDEDRLSYRKLFPWLK
jgi:excisionase family DNA binding protein